MNSLVNKILFRDYLKNRILISTLFIISIFEYLLIILLNNISNNDYGYTIALTKYILALTLMLFVFLAIYVNMFLIEDSQFQLSVLMVNGKSSYSLTKQIMRRYLMILFIITCLGSLVGYLFIGFVLNGNVGNVIFINNSDFLNSVYLVFLLFLLKCIYIFMINVGKLRNIRFKLISYLNNISRKENKVGYFSSFIVEKETKKFPYVKVICLILLFMVFFGAFNLICTVQLEYLNFFIGMMGVIISFILITRILIPILFDFFHKHLLKSKIWIIAYNDFISLYQNILSLIAMIVTIIPIFLYLIFISNEDPKIIYIICYFVTIVSLIMCCFFKYYVYFNGKKKQIITLNSIGYTFKDIYRIQIRELFLMFVLLYFLPTVIYIIMILKINITILEMVLLLIYVVPLAILYIFNKILIKNKMREVIENEQRKRNSFQIRR